MYKHRNGNVFVILSMQRIRSKHAVQVSSHVLMGTASLSHWFVMATMTAGITVMKLQNCSVVRFCILLHFQCNTLNQNLCSSTDDLVLYCLASHVDPFCPFSLSFRTTYLQFQPVHLSNLASWPPTVCALDLCV